MSKKNVISPKKKVGFSLTELSAIILVVSLLATAFTTSPKATKKNIDLAKITTNDSRIEENYSENLIAWYDSSREDAFPTTEAIDNTAISQWNDYSGLNNPATQLVSANKPAYISKAINNLPAVKFDGNDDFFSYIGPLAPFGIFIVEQRISAENNGYILGHAANQNGFTFGWTNSFTKTFYNEGENGAVFLDVPTNNLLTNIHYLERSDEADSSLVYFMNGAQVKAFASLSGILENPTPGQIIGCGSESPLNCYHGYIGEIIIIDRTLNMEERNNIFSYLSKKWNVKIY